MQPNNRPHSAHTPQGVRKKQENPTEPVVLSTAAKPRPWPRERPRPSFSAVALDALMRSPLARRVSPLLRAALQRISDLALRAQTKLPDVLPPNSPS
jgi:hypothetical protein